MVWTEINWVVSGKFLLPLSWWSRNHHVSYYGFWSFLVLKLHFSSDARNWFRQVVIGFKHLSKTFSLGFLSQLVNCAKKNCKPLEVECPLKCFLWSASMKWNGKCKQFRRSHVMFTFTHLSILKCLFSVNCCPIY